jgi:hypothetical protein
MIVAIALATGTAPGDWWGEDDATLVTALELLEDAHEQARRRR